MRFRILTILLAYTTSTTLPLKAQINPQQLQDTLAKIVFAQQVTVVQKSFGPHIGKEAWTHNAFSTEVQQKLLSLQVSGVSSGLLKDIANQPLSDFVTASTGSMLELGEGMAMINNDVAHFTAQEMMADVRWSNNPTLPAFSGTFNDFVKLSTSDNRYDCIGYTSATLAVSF